MGTALPPDRAPSALLVTMRMMARDREPSKKKENEPITLPRRFVAVGVLAVVLPAWAVLLTYLYERGYADVFGIDKSFIDVTTGSIVATGLHFLKWLALASVIVEFVGFGLSRVQFRSRDLMYVYMLFEALLLGALLYWAAWDFSTSALGKGLAYAAGLTIVLASVMALFRLLGRHEGPDEPSLGRAIELLIDSGYFPVVAAAVILAFAANWAGTADATRQQYFQVIRGDPSVVVLRRYGDRVVTARLIGHRMIDATSRGVLILGQNGASKFERRKLGRLRVHP